MNKVYKIVWNTILNSWVVVSELAKGKTKGSSKKIQQVGSIALISGMITFSPHLFAEAGTGGEQQGALTLQQYLIRVVLQ